MKTRSLCLAAALVAVAGRSPAQAQPLESTIATEARQQAQAFQRVQRSGRELSRAVRKVMRDLEWHEKLEDAVAAAGPSDKPILWIQVLGELDGFA